MSQDSRKPKQKQCRIDPLDVTESLGYQTHRRGARKPWSKEEDELLRSSVNSSLIQMGYPEGIESVKSIQESNSACKRIHWDEIATRFDRNIRKTKDIRKRWTSSLDPNLKKGKWTIEEDEQLMKSYEKWGAQWLKISSEIPGRTEDQCAKRYIEVLDPSTKDRLRSWSLEEDLSLISKVKKYGTRWRKISTEMESRPSLTCRNRWRKIITMIMRGKASDTIAKAVQETSQNKELQSLDELRETLQMKIEGLNEDAAFDENQDQPISENRSTSEVVKSENTNGVPNNNALSSATSRSHSSSTSPAAIRPPSRNKTQSLPLFKDLAQPSISTDQNKHKKVGESNLSKVGQGSNSSKHATPTSTHMDWRFALKDNAGLHISEGTISNSDLVKELIENARKRSVKISIHQHIHNHYGFVPQINNAQTPGSGADYLNQFSPLPFYGEANNGDKLPNELELEADFLSRTPNYASLALDSTLQAEQLLQPKGITFQQLQHHHHHYSSLPINPQKAPPPSSTGSHSTTGADLEEIGPGRKFHFNYLPPSVKPQLNSSDPSHTPDLGSVSNPSPSGQNTSNRRKRRKRTKQSSSEGNTPLTNNICVEVSPKGISESRDEADTQKHISGLTPATVSTVGEEEGLDFWESLRSLAAVPENDVQNVPIEGQSDEYGFFYNIYDSKPDLLGIGPQQRTNSDKGPNNGGEPLDTTYKGLPFNPS
ncbi:LAFE_0F00606g1_1 [Lachancea fermentati]|uniref:LAFE_0F00606g1_1 n=1 Tax=Lachancea fermentati TaxID=4955 RepID=A0A1G4MEJ7_LACFM|nr:LAFE_0F00606g1_1 [Lachancea fermentati]